MKFRIKPFAFFRQALGASELDYELPEDSTVEDLLNDIFKKHPSLAKSREHVVVSINQVAASSGARIKEGDVISILPPMSGG